jgi:hypothetical protein
MESDHLKIVCYTGGTCGDLITAMIDCRDVVLRQMVVMHDSYRQQLKKPFTFADDSEKDDYLEKISTKYNSIPSHDLDYHVKRNHKFISIVVDEFKVAKWAAKRFKNLHRPHVWEEMQKACGAQTVDDYAQILIDYSNMIKQHTDKLVRLEAIRNGQGIEELDLVLETKLDSTVKNLYQNWRLLQMHL